MKSKRRGRSVSSVGTSKRGTGASLLHARERHLSYLFYNVAKRLKSQKNVTIGFSGHIPISKCLHGRPSVDVPGVPVFFRPVCVRER